MTDYEKAKQAVASRISTLMQERNYDAVDLYRLSGIAAQSIRKFVKGDAMPRSDADRKRIARVLGTTMEELFAEVIAFRFATAAKAGQTNRENAQANNDKVRELAQVIAQSKQARQVRIAQVNQSARHSRKATANCRRGAYYFKRMSSTAAVPRCCALDECLVGGKA